jgi:hypothetical protein
MLDSFHFKTNADHMGSFWRPFRPFRQPLAWTAAVRRATKLAHCLPPRQAACTTAAAECCADRAARAARPASSALQAACTMTTAARRRRNRARALHIRAAAWICSHDHHLLSDRSWNKTAQLTAAQHCRVVTAAFQQTCVSRPHLHCG